MRSELVAEEVWFAHQRRAPVLAGTSLRVGAGEVVGLSGPSGVGKSTLGRILAGLLTASRGSVHLDGAPIQGPGRGVQYLVQDPAAGMNPRWQISRVLDEAGPADLGDPVEAALVDRTWLDRRPHEISGGQLQRVNVARALRVRPAYLVADEITASLDAVTQVRVWRQILEVARQRRIGVLAISHDHDLLARISDRVESWH